MAYENRIVAFDVLGFSNLVYSATTDKISKDVTMAGTEGIET